MGGDRRDLRLRDSDVELVRAVAAANPRTVVVVIGGGTVVLDPWDQEVAAVLLGWYPGMEGGRALADVLLGDEEPGGRLPVAIPHRTEDLPVFDWHARSVRYERWWGQPKLDRDGVAAAYPFGYGLGYTRFALEDLRLGPVDEEARLSASVIVRNTGQRDGRHVVRIYAVQQGNTGREIRTLLGFQPVTVKAGAAVAVDVACTLAPLQRWTPAGFLLDAADVILEAASYSGDPAAASLRLTLPASSPPGLSSSEAIDG